MAPFLENISFTQTENNPNRRSNYVRPTCGAVTQKQTKNRKWSVEIYSCNDSCFRMTENLISAQAHFSGNTVNVWIHFSATRASR